MNMMQLTALAVIGGGLAIGLGLAAYYLYLAAASGAGETNDGEEGGQE